MCDLSADGESNEEPVAIFTPLSVAAASPVASAAIPNLSKEIGNMTLDEIGIIASDIDNPTTPAASVKLAVKRIQRQIRAWLYRRHEAAKTLQSATRSWLERRKVEKQHHAAVVIQSSFRRRNAQKEFAALKAATLLVQKRFRERHALRQHSETQEIPR